MTDDTELDLGQLDPRESCILLEDLLRQLHPQAVRENVLDLIGEDGE